MSIHIGAQPGDIADTVLLPGDPLRAKWIADTFFTDVQQYNSVRNMLGYTGTWNGRRVSAQGSGMGQPSLSIYAHELFNDYKVRTAIRVGTCGGLGEVKLRDVVIAMSASTDSRMNERIFGGLDFAPCANFDLLEAAVGAARAANVPFHVGGVGSMDVFYDETNAADVLERHGTLALEMETSALYTMAARFGARALSILTVSDHIRSGEQTSSQEREQGFAAMVQIALTAAAAA